MEKLFTCLIDHIPHAIFWKDINLIFQGCNKQFAQQFGYSNPSDIIGKSDYDFPFPLHLIELYRIDDQIIVTTGIPKLNYEEKQLQMDGSEKILLVSKVPFYDENQNVIGIIGIYTDITNRKEEEKQLKIAKELAEAANLAKTEFIANMSHDIRTPLTGVVGMSKILEENAVDPDQKKYAHWLLESGDQLLHMLNGILEVVSADNTNVNDLHEDSFVLKRVIQDIVELERPSTQVKGIDLITQVDERIPSSLISDHTKLHRILLNLIGNAIKFTEKGRITLDVKLLEQHNTHVLLQFSVSDTGIGIPPEMQNMVFDRFFRVTPSYKGIYTGYGVGLHIAQSYAHLLGGEIKTTSKFGVGTTFYFNLSLKIGDKTTLYPLSTKPSTDGSTDSHSPLPQRISTDLPSITMKPSPSAPNLLLIEDNLIALRVLESIVTQSGWQFTSAIDGESAFELVCKNAFDLIITDIGLPGISGIDLTIKIREFEASLSKKQTPIIGLTAHAQSEVRDACLASGMNDVFSKPMDMDTLATIKISYLT